MRVRMLLRIVERKIFEANYAVPPMLSATGDSCVTRAEGRIRGLRKVPHATRATSSQDQRVSGIRSEAISGDLPALDRALKANARALSFKWQNECSLAAGSLTRGIRSSMVWGVFLGWRRVSYHDSA